MTKKELLKSIKENNGSICGNLYDYIANNYWNMSKEELKDVCLEVIYSLDYKWWDKDDAQKVRTDLIENIDERMTDDEED